MTVTRIYTYAPPGQNGKPGVIGTGNLGNYSWQRTNPCPAFTAASGYTVSKITAIVTYNNKGSSNATIMWTLLPGTSPRLTFPKGSASQVEIEFKNQSGALITDPSFFTDGSTYGNSGGTSGNFSIHALKFYYTKSNTVTAGNPINASTWTDLGLSATQYSKIVDSNFTQNATIKASDWNSKSITINHTIS